MKLLNTVFVFGLAIFLASCNSNTKETPTVSMQESEETEEYIEEADEVEYLESAIDALKEMNYDLAAEKILKAAGEIKGYVSEMDDPANANIAVQSLMELATKIKGGEKITADQLEEKLLKLDFFNEDDLELDDEAAEEE